MVHYLNPGGHNWGRKNLDGYGISQVVFAVVYSIIFYSLCAYVWAHRNHPAIKMRKIGLALVSVNILHVYEFAVFLVYLLNGDFPCNVEFWIMSIYLPIGIGLYQAQNQQLLIVSTEQHRLLYSEDYKPLYPGHGRGVGGPKFWLWRAKLWWNSTSKQGKYEGYVLIGMIVQFFGSLIIYLVSRKFNAFGIVSSPVSPGMCRRGWEWAPSIIWQLLWNLIFGPYLLWNIRGIHDIYHWRLQTTIAVIAGLPGTPLWLIAVYTDSFASINKYWVPAMWLVPGIIAVEITTVGFPVMHIRQHKKAAAATKKALAMFDLKKLRSKPSATSSRTSQSLDSKKGKMYSMDSLEECLILPSTCDAFQDYATAVEFCGENVIFLTKVLKFKQQWHVTLSQTHNISGAMKTLYREALSIYIHLIHASTALYPINIESPIYAQLEKVFGSAAVLVACKRRGSEGALSITSSVTPWEDITPTPTEQADPFADELPLKAIPSRPGSRSNSSSDRILTIHDDQELADTDVLGDMLLPDEFDNNVFDAALNSVKYMVWTETWQHYHKWKRASGTTKV